MADTIRERIIQAFITRVGTIRVSGGFKTDIGARVVRAVRPEDFKNLPLVAVFPGDDVVLGYLPKKIRMQMPVKVEGITLDETGGLDVTGELMLGDILYAVTKTRVSTLVTACLYVGGGVGSYEYKDSLAGAFASFNVNYYVSNVSPYNQ